MNESENFAAAVLEKSSGAYAAYAAELLLDCHPDIASRFPGHSFDNWKNHLKQRIEELAVALDLDSPQLFRSAVHWSRESFVARELPEADLRNSLICLREVLSQNLPERAKQQTEKIFDDALEVFGSPLPPRQQLKAETAESRLALAYVRACLEGNRRLAIQMVSDAVDAGMGVQEASLKVLAPAQEEVGRLWHAGLLGIHEEHFVTSTTQTVLALLSTRAHPSGANGKTVIGAAVQGNAHELGIRVVVDLFEIAGWTAICLGADVPATALARAAEDYNGDLVVLSVAVINQLKGLREIVGLLRTTSPRVKIMAGGLALAEIPEVWRRLGLDGYCSSAEEAVAFGARLTGIAT